MIRKDFWLLGFLFLFALQLAASDEGAEIVIDEGEEGEIETEEHYAILFPWFTQLLGVCVFFIASRYISIFPYTAVMFLLGTCMGIGVNRLDNVDQLSASIRIWESIN